MDSFWRPKDLSPLHGPEEAERSELEATGSPDARIRHLQRVPLFSGFSEGDLHRVVETSKIVEARPGAVLTTIGDPGDSFFVIIDGKVTVQTPVGVGDFLRPGDFFGEMSLLDGEPRSATVTATTAVRMLVVDRAHFWRLLDEAPGLTREILLVLSRRVRRLEEAANAFLRWT
jgi:CRP/FNR family transcriptional regulator, cyclic AMP receptor protein